LEGVKRKTKSSQDPALKSKERTRHFMVMNRWVEVFIRWQGQAV
jgi:hypothetical protein